MIVAEEALEVYKDVDEVVNVVRSAVIAKKVARLRSIFEISDCLTECLFYAIIYGAWQETALRPDCGVLR